MSVSELLRASDVAALVASIPVGTRTARMARCIGSVRSRRKTASLTFVMLNLDAEEGHWEANNRGESSAAAISDSSTTADVQLVLAADESLAPYLSTGAWLSCAGELGCDRAESLSLYVDSVTLRRAAPEPSALARILDDASARRWPGSIEAAAAALCESVLEFDRLAALPCGGLERKHGLVALSRRMRGLPSAQRPSRQRTHLSGRDIAVLEAAEHALGDALRIEEHWEPQVAAKAAALTAEEAAKAGAAKKAAAEAGNAGEAATEAAAAESELLLSLEDEGPVDVAT